MPLLMLLHFQFFRWNMLHLSRKYRINFYFGFDSEKTIPVYIPTHLVISFI